MQKQKLAFNYPPELRKSISDAQKDIGCQSRKTRTTLIRSSAIRLLTKIKKKLSLIIRRLPLISLKCKISTPKSVKKKTKEIQLLRSMPPR